MATSTLVQLLANEAEGGSASTSHRTQSETFIANGTITLGDWVAFDTSKTGSDRALYVIQAAGVATVGSAACIGVALASAVAGGQIRVCVSGYAEKANVAGAVVAGSPLVGPIGTGGQAAIEVPGTTSGGLIGVALAVDVANIGPVIVYKRF